MSTAVSPTTTGQQPRAAEGVEVGKFVGRWRIERTIGQGTYGKVRLAVDPVTAEKVAVKVIDKSQVQSSKQIARLQREIRFLRLLHHPHIVKVYDVNETEQFIHIIMEYAPGGELFDYIVAHKRVKEREARSFFRQVLSAVDYCHKNAVIHRDLKPENLLLDESKTIKIIDFGFGNNFTVEGLLDTFCGSPFYAAPEMIMGKKYEGPEVDMWSLGVILFALLCGHLPFDDDNMKELYRKIATGTYTCPDYLMTNARHLIRRLIHVHPKERATLEEVLAHPWVNEGYDCPPPNYLPARVEIRSPAELSKEILQRLLVFGYTMEDVEREFGSNANQSQPSPVRATYFLLAEMFAREEARQKGDRKIDLFEQHQQMRRGSLPVDAVGMLGGRFKAASTPNVAMSNQTASLGHAGNRCAAGDGPGSGDSGDSYSRVRRGMENGSALPARKDFLSMHSVAESTRRRGSTPEDSALQIEQNCGGSAVQAPPNAKTRSSGAQYLFFQKGHRPQSAGTGEQRRPSGSNSSGRASPEPTSPPLSSYPRRPSFKPPSIPLPPTPQPKDDPHNPTAPATGKLSLLHSNVKDAPWFRRFSMPTASLSHPIHPPPREPQSASSATSSQTFAPARPAQNYLSGSRRGSLATASSAAGERIKEDFRAIGGWFLNMSTTTSKAADQVLLQLVSVLQKCKIAYTVEAQHPSYMESMMALLQPSGGDGSQTSEMNAAAVAAAASTADNHLVITLACEVWPDSFPHGNRTPEMESSNGTDPMTLLTELESRRISVSSTLPATQWEREPSTDSLSSASTFGDPLMRDRSQASVASTEPIPIPDELVDKSPTETLHVQDHGPAPELAGHHPTSPPTQLVQHIQSSLPSLPTRKPTSKEIGFQVSIYKMPKSVNSTGLHFRRVHGGVWTYKKVCNKILAQMSL